MLLPLLAVALPSSSFLPVLDAQIRSHLPEDIRHMRGTSGAIHAISRQTAPLELK
ncbi:MAG: hypothetical protein M3454_14565 [Actinomycetota bacterium]|nr:hypothetical protein [Actinomycetota bacterium]